MTEAGALRGILLVVAAGVSFSLIDSIAKTLARSYPPMMVAWARYAFHVVVMLVLLWPKMQGRLIATSRPGLQTIRGLCLGMSTITFFLAIARMPLAEATAIVAVGPILVTVAAVLWLNETAPRGSGWALGASFIGVLLIIRPGSEIFSPVALLPLATAVFGCGYALLTRKLAGVDDSVATLFIGGLVAAVLMTMLVPLWWTMPRSLLDWGMLVTMGAVGAGGHLFLVRAYEHASATTLAPYGYAHAVAALPLGFVFFGTFPDVLALAGMALIVATGVVMAIWRHMRVEPIEE